MFYLQRLGEAAVDDAQIDYAAADAHVLTVLFDRCFHHSPDAIATALADPTRPLAAVPEAPKGARVNKRERRDKAEENHRRQVERFIAPVGPPPHPTDVPSVVGDVFEGRKQVSAAFGGDGSSSGRGGGVDECGDFLALFVNVGRTNRRYANEFWVEFESNEVLGSNPCGGKVMMSWFPGGGGLREIASALVDTEGEDEERGLGESKSGEVEDAFAFSPPGQGGVHVRRAVGPGAHAREWGGRRARGFSPRGRARSSRRGSRRVRAARRGRVDD